MYKNANFSIYIYRVLKQVHPAKGMSGDGLSSMNNLVRIMLQRLMQSVNRIMVSTNGRKTVGSREVQTAVRLTLPGELSKHSVNEGTKAVTKYNAYKTERSDAVRDTSGDKAKPVSRAFMAGLSFPVTRIGNIMKELANAERQADTAPVYMAAVLEYLVAEVLELAGNAANTSKKVRITPRHIKLGILNDSELDKLFTGVVLSGGVIPHIAGGPSPSEEEKVVKKKPVKKVTKKPVVPTPEAKKPIATKKKVTNPKK